MKSITPYLKKSPAFRSVILRTLLFCSLFTFISLPSCKEKDPILVEVYAEGTQIPGTEVFFPLGLFDFPTSAPKLNPVRTLLAYTVKNGPIQQNGLYVLNLQTQQKTRLDANGQSPDWSPDGNWLTFNRGGQIYKCRKDGSDVSQLTFRDEIILPDGSRYSNNCFSPDWHPDGTKIAYYYSIDYRSELDGSRIMDANGQELKRKIPLGDPNWHPDGERMIGIKGNSATSGATLFPIYNTATDTVLQVLQPTANQTNVHVEYSPDGKRLVYWNATGVWLMQADGSSFKRILPCHLVNHSGPVTFSAGPASWSSDNVHLIYEHFRVTATKRTSNGLLTEGYISLYQVNADSAMAKSNLP